MLKEYQSKIMDLFTRQELIIAEIYQFFSSLYPDNRKLWDELAKEKLERAGWIEYLHKKSQLGEIHFTEGRIKTYTVESFIRYLDEQLLRVKHRALSQQAAISLAVNIENSLLEKNIFEHFTGMDKEFDLLLHNLRNKYYSSRKRLEKMSTAPVLA